MNTNTKTLFFSILILGAVLSLLTVTTVMASANDILSQQQRDQDRDQLYKTDNICLDDGLCERHQHQRGSESPDCGNSIPEMNQAQYRYQHRHCHNQGN